MRVKNIAVLDETLYNKVINDAYEIMIGRRYKYKMKRHTCFTVLGKPFFSIGGQLHNSSGYSLGAQSGSWEGVFGGFGAELCMAWGIARYIDEIAQAGKEIYDIFMYVNVWMDRNGENGWSRDWSGRPRKSMTERDGISMCRSRALPM